VCDSPQAPLAGYDCAIDRFVTHHCGKFCRGRLVGMIELGLPFETGDDDDGKRDDYCDNDDA